MSRERYLVSSYGDNLEGTLKGLAAFFELCLKHGSGVIVVPTIGNIDGTLFTKVLPEKISKALIKHKKVSIGDGRTITLCGSTTLRKHTREKVYLALWGTRKVTEEIESSCHSCVALVLVTWLPEDAHAWVKGHKVTSIYDDGVKQAPNL
ncbi:hypothetical protein [Pseudomonas alliivorans]|uniref:hypothetical protein n=1 Tax=Pseudomonas alliivorans TaxID=2810613 RepID=UPI002090C1B3|nr:hypothetical protein [Pseudomonas alliivorans]MCO5367807.1 hypothetical protein [Pseudomonas alliivorans]MEE4896698.1 hypothetical protein [Pseudomonas alliivorans]